MILNTSTRSVEDDEAKVPAIVEASKKYLADNGISYTEFCDDPTDPRIAVIAACLAEYDKNNHHLNIQTKTTVGGCALQAVGLKGLGEGGVKAAAKQIGKAVLKKAVPYVGWGLFAVEMVMCLSE